MTIVAEEACVPAGSATGRSRIQLTLRCDICQHTFTKHQNVKKLKERSNHYCSQGCFNAAFKKGGVPDVKRRATNNAKYSADYVIARPDVAKELSRRAHSVAASNKRTKTVLERYNVACVLQVPSIKEANRLATNSPEAIAKCQKTMLSRHGVRSGFLLPHVRKKCIASMNTPEAWKKRYETLKTGGKLFSSLAEDTFYEMLCDALGQDDIERWVTVNGWSIDLHVVSLDTYIQVDGVYWHGLDRPLEEIRRHITERDAVIAKKYDRDRIQDAWFKDNGLRLLRVTDMQVKQGCRIDALLDASYEDR